MSTLQHRFEARVISWRGPAPYVFAVLPVEVAAAIRALGARASYGWGVIPVEAEIAGVTFTTSLFPREGTYLMPRKVALRRQVDVQEGAEVMIEMRLTRPRLEEGE